jgi:hypothetical protein
LSWVFPSPSNVYHFRALTYLSCFTDITGMAVWAPTDFASFTQMHAFLGLDRVRDSTIWGLISIEWLWETVAHATDTLAIHVNIMRELP